MKYLIFILLPLLITFNQLYCCTTFVINDKNGGYIFGRNLDWVSENGTIVVNKKGVKKKSITFSPSKSVKWVSKFGSVTFNQFGKEFPFGGMNENGLVVEIMRAPANYPPFDSKKGALNEIQWVQYQLDNAENIDDIIKSDKKIRIESVKQKLHYLVADRYGKVAVIEFISGKMKVYKDKDLPYPVLENEPYLRSLFKYKFKINTRFKKATNMVKKYSSKNNIIKYGFKILDKVALDGSWSIIYDIKNRTIYYKTASNQNIRYFDIKKFDYSCKTDQVHYHILKNKKGDIFKFFTPFTHKFNKKIMKKAFIKNEIFLPKNIVKKFYNHHKSSKCLKK